MLQPPSSKTHWVPKPGNPNFLIPIKEDEDEEEEEEKPKVEIKKPKIGMVEPTQFERQAALILNESLAPLYNFIGMLEAESGKTIYYRYLPGASVENRRIPINFGSETYDEFLQNNRHLSNELVQGLFRNETSVKIKKESLIGFNVNDFPIYYPAWYWSQINTPVFRFLLSSATFGALELAANELGFPLKHLIYSPHVNYMFAQFVAKKFVSPKNNAYVSGINGGQSQYRISSGFNTSQMANTKWIMGCKEWFKGVSYASNPLKSTDLDALIAQQEQKVAAFRGLPMIDPQRMGDKERAEQELERLLAARASYANKILKK